jgi:omega-hydroxy-beta-dihydromenaquinone-9 sulfotransferase
VNKHRKRLLLKSPPHTARIKVLNEMFPGAVYIHIVRDPQVVFASTVNLWRTFQRSHGMQTPAYEGLEEQVLRTFERMHKRLEEARALLRPGQLYELRYEDLVRDPAGELRKIYDHFQFSGFEACLPRLKGYLENISAYETNKYCLSDDQRDLVTRRWGHVIRRYGYGTSASRGRTMMKVATRA